MLNRGVAVGGRGLSLICSNGRNGVPLYLEKRGKSILNHPVFIADYKIALGSASFVIWFPKRCPGISGPCGTSGTNPASCGRTWSGDLRGDILGLTPPGGPHAADNGPLAAFCSAQWKPRQQNNIVHAKWHPTKRFICDTSKQAVES